MVVPFRVCVCVSARDNFRNRLVDTQPLALPRVPEAPAGIAPSLWIIGDFWIIAAPQTSRNCSPMWDTYLHIHIVMISIPVCVSGSSWSKSKSSSSMTCYYATRRRPVALSSLSPHYRLCVNWIGPPPQPLPPSPNGAAIDTTCILYYRSGLLKCVPTSIGFNLPRYSTLLYSLLLPVRQRRNYTASERASVNAIVAQRTSSVGLVVVGWMVQ